MITTEPSPRNRRIRRERSHFFKYAWSVLVLKKWSFCFENCKVSCFFLLCCWSGEGKRELVWERWSVERLYKPGGEWWVPSGWPRVESVTERGMVWVGVFKWKGYFGNKLKKQSNMVQSWNLSHFGQMHPLPSLTPFVFVSVFFCFYVC